MYAAFWENLSVLEAAQARFGHYAFKLSWRAVTCMILILSHGENVKIHLAHNIIHSLIGNYFIHLPQGFDNFAPDGC